MELKKHKQKILRFIGNLLLSNVINVLCKTLKLEHENKPVIDKLFIENQNFVIAFWHGTMLVPWFINRNRNFGALVSNSKDGDLLAKILIKWNYIVARGSSNSGGKEALATLLNFADKNYSVAITPDGPTGPPHKMKAGAVITAKKAGIPLILLGINYSKKYVLNSWDKFQIPKPFSKIYVIYSEPIFVNKNLSYDETSNIILECETELNNLQSKAENSA
ncbi:hypothetical protein BMS3Abin04_02149 [bacterium BMS3Abin04]|nr:hypothetical protein BMS3Abin04_02149 [bacterium BMS3Abin04]